MPTRKPRLLQLILFAGLPALAMTLPVFAQVYRSTDAEGNVTFSDQPTSESEAVDVPPTNVGDSVEVPPPAPEPAPEPVLKPEPEIAAEKLPSQLEGDLVGYERKDKNRRSHRYRPEHYGHGR
jgi:hypothetical protein